MNGFSLHPRLEADTVHLSSLDNAELRLMNDARWPWVILVPTAPGAEEWHDLEDEIRLELDKQITKIAEVLKHATRNEKINIAMIGNIVRQLHIHIIARNPGDANWPGPVWGYGTQEQYSPSQLDEIVTKLSAALGELTG